MQFQITEEEFAENLHDWLRSTFGGSIVEVETEYGKAFAEILIIFKIFQFTLDKYKILCYNNYNIIRVVETGMCNSSHLHFCIKGCLKKRTPSENIGRSFSLIFFFYDCCLFSL